MHAIVQISVSMRKICWQACNTLARLRRSLFCTLYLLNKGQFSAFRHVETIITWDCFSDCFVSDCFFFSFIFILSRTVLYWTVLYWTVLYGTVLYRHHLGDTLSKFCTAICRKSISLLNQKEKKQDCSFQGEALNVPTAF